ncbi:Di-copper centre-containing protein [Sistotremastrum suecicum HHB10207 ss-3]|uniref:tyrosinase n=1 Tax=Sistotremastrum suecicum HHB10207 ss-3 TaxID=1314776 RepID=A0A166DZQ5_9AGAM|nr:Di-copper centre-containing protein [Sistotremastrum suecicum HHB10207 ss-3]
MSTYAITGIQQNLGPAPGQTPVRQEINAWAANPENIVQVNLFYLALAKFQEIPYEEKLSYFQIAGIHGLPLVPWDEKTESKTPGTQNGYCTHNSILFPTWHRPYLILYEQKIHEIMVNDVIPQFPANQRPDLIKHANSWRLPFWDWGLKNPDVPDIVRPATVTVQTPSGQTATISNPLAAFKAPEAMGKWGIQAVGSSPFDKARATSRYPPKGFSQPQDVEAWVNGVQLNDLVRDALRGADWYQNPVGQPPKYPNNISEVVYRLFSEKYFSSYLTFASTNFVNEGGPADYLSLEAIHNNIHLWSGGGGPRDKTNHGAGHMSIVPVAAYDPIFWLHHNNIDHYFAVWQTLNQDVWFSKPSEQLKDPNGNWSTVPGTVPTPKTPLAPFHTDTHATYFDSDKVRDWTKYGYTYPELQPWLPKYHVGGQFNHELYILDIRTQVNKLYGTTRDQFFSIDSGADVLDKEDYVVNVEYERFALGGEPFVIHILIGNNKVGQVSNFSSPPAESGCANCEVQQQARVVSTGQVPITDPLLSAVSDERIALYDLGPDSIGHYLKHGNNLNWKVTKIDGEEVPLSEIPSVKVSVAAGKGSHYKDHKKISKYHGYTVLHAVTEGRPGGLGHNDH